ncbi:3294_t:CDS:1 [Paraglomus brasilianum]|uniref:3294_t:CDS:1 n=1 Tax=Paraglomus brasilianum TaxID=144538 RepID=A0A9N8WJL8_9GLOM|nr:3294_t:CDS:1 [Paraglomus brasilianum]
MSSQESITETKSSTTATKFLPDNNSTKSTLESIRKNSPALDSPDRLRESLRIVQRADAYSANQGKTILYYMVNPNELREHHKVWHYFYLCVLITAAFAAIFIGPVIFGMLAMFAGIGAPIALSFLGSGIGLLSGIGFGVLLAVVCIVALVRAVGIAAEWILNTLWYGGSDLWEITKAQMKYIISSEDE